jgi:hypothetical protein
MLSPPDNHSGRSPIFLCGSGSSGSRTSDIDSLTVLHWVDNLKRPSHEKGTGSELRLWGVRLYRTYSTVYGPCLRTAMGFPLRPFNSCDFQRFQKAGWKIVWYCSSQDTNVSAEIGHRMHGACDVIDAACKMQLKMQNTNDTACTVHAVPLTPHVKYDTACTIKVSYPNTTKIN